MILTYYDMEDKIKNQEKVITEHKVIFSANAAIKQLTVYIDNTRRNLENDKN